MTVDAGSTGELQLQLHGHIHLDGSYQLTVAHQATVNDDDVTVVVHGPDGPDLAPQGAFSLTEDRVLSYALGTR